jgi:uncharacterized protein (DUF1778 family)
MSPQPETPGLAKGVGVERLHWLVESAPAPGNLESVLYTVTCAELPGLVHVDTDVQRCLRTAIEGAKQFIQTLGPSCLRDPGEESEPKRRTAQINLKLTEDEYALVRRGAECVGATVSAFVRKAAVDAAKTGIPEVQRSRGQAFEALRAVLSTPSPGAQPEKGG